MKIVQKETFGEVTAFKLGFSPMGPVMMCVYFYRIGHVMVDTGQSNMQKIVLDILKDTRPAHLLLTHYHEDHSGNAAAIRQKFGTRVCGHPLTAARMKQQSSILPYQHLIWGRSEPVMVHPVTEIIETGTHRFLPVHTPGHCTDHTVYLEPDCGWLFTGDLYLGDRIKFFRADERISDQIASLKTVLTLDFESLFCSHRPRPQKGKMHIRRKLAFLEDVRGRVGCLLEKGYPENKILKKLSNGQARKEKWLTFGNVSHANIIRSAILSYKTPETERYQADNFFYPVFNGWK